MIVAVIIFLGGCLRRLLQPVTINKAETVKAVAERTITEFFIFPNG